MSNLIEVLDAQNVKSELPVVEVGSTVRVHIKIKEGSKERIQIFEGTVIAKKHGGVGETFTVRRISYGVGVEKVFPVNSPNVVKVETIRKVTLPERVYFRALDRICSMTKASHFSSVSTVQFTLW